MKFNKATQAKLILEEKMKGLIIAAMNRMDSDDLLQLMYDKCCSNVQKDYLRDKMTSILSLEGIAVLKVQSMKDQDKLNDFLCNEIFPLYNDQQTHLSNFLF